MKFTKINAIITWSLIALFQRRTLLGENCPVISYKVKENNKMDSMYRHENFEFKRQSSNDSYDTVDCQIRRLGRPANQVPLAAQNGEDSDPNIRWDVTMR